MKKSVFPGGAAWKGSGFWLKSPSMPGYTVSLRPLGPAHWWSCKWQTAPVSNGTVSSRLLVLSSPQLDDSTVARELAITDSEHSDAEVSCTDNGTFNLSRGQTPLTEGSEGERNLGHELILAPTVAAQLCRQQGHHPCLFSELWIRWRSSFRGMAPARWHCCCPGSPQSLSGLRIEAHGGERESSLASKGNRVYKWRGKAAQCQKPRVETSGYLGLTWWGWDTGRPCHSCHVSDTPLFLQT